MNGGDAAWVRQFNFRHNRADARICGRVVRTLTGRLTAESPCRRYMPTIEATHERAENHVHA